MVLLCLGCSGNLCLVLYLEKENGERILHMFGGQRDKKNRRKRDGERAGRGKLHVLEEQSRRRQRNDERERESSVPAHLRGLDDFCEVVQDGPDVVLQPLVVVLQQRLFALGQHPLSSHRSPVHGQSQNTGARSVDEAEDEATEKLTTSLRGREPEQRKRWRKTCISYLHKYISSQVP